MNSIVIGSGFGGIAAALRLKAKGHQVKLIEKHPDLGGRARVFKKNGFIFDGGPTVITAPYLINELFELFKKDPKNYIELSPLKMQLGYFQVIADPVSICVHDIFEFFPLQRPLLVTKLYIPPLPSSSPGYQF